MPGQERNVDDRRTFCKRPVERQSECCGASVLLVLNALVHALLTIAGSGTVLRSPSRRAAHSRGCHRCRIQSFPPGCGNAVQHRLRSPAIVREADCARTVPGEIEAAAEAELVVWRG